MFVLCNRKYERRVQKFRRGGILSLPCRCVREDTNGQCDAVFFTHYHGDHMGQMTRIRQEIPLYAGVLAKDIMLTVAGRDPKKNEVLCKRIQAMRTFGAGDPLFGACVLPLLACLQYRGRLDRRDPL